MTMIFKNFYASAYKEFQYFRRTAVNTMTSVIVFYVIFFMIISSYKFFFRSD